MSEQDNDVAIEKNDAIEEAKRELNPDATSNDEDAWILAELIHSLGLQARSARFEMRANGHKLTDRFERQVNTPGGPIIGYIEDDDGDETTPAGKPCRTTGQHIATLEQRAGDLWLAADEEGIGRKIVEEKLAEVKKLSLERMKSARDS